MANQPAFTIRERNLLQVTVVGDPLCVTGPPTGPTWLPARRCNFRTTTCAKGQPGSECRVFSDPGSWAIGNEPRYLSGMRNPFNLNENIAAAIFR